MAEVAMVRVALAGMPLACGRPLEMHAYCDGLVVDTVNGLFVDAFPNFNIYSLKIIGRQLQSRQVAECMSQQHRHTCAYRKPSTRCSRCPYQ